MDADLAVAGGRERQTDKRSSICCGQERQTDAGLAVLGGQNRQTGSRLPVLGGRSWQTDDRFSMQNRRKSRRLAAATGSSSADEMTSILPLTSAAQRQWIDARLPTKQGQILPSIEPPSYLQNNSVCRFITKSATASSPTRSLCRKASTSNGAANSSTKSEPRARCASCSRS